jgi:hypothetical protein
MAIFSAIATITMKEIYVVLGFFLLVGLQILRMVEEQRREAPSTDRGPTSVAPCRTRNYVACTG